MSNFASLLSQVQQSAQSIASKTSRPTTSDADNTEESPRNKRVRLLDAKDFPPVQKIFLLCPAGVQTGGPEALHQLCDQLNESTNIPAYMLYAVSDGVSAIFASRAKTPVPYRHYNAPAVSYDALQHSGSSKSSNLFLWPECWTDEMMDYLEQQSDNPTPCAIWWLSVNNNNGRFHAWSRKDILHLYQSEYAKQHVLSHGATHVYPMTEYISTIHPQSHPNEASHSAENSRSIDVLFNPLKGKHYTDEIRKRSDAVMEFRPIGAGPEGRDRISPDEVRELLQRANIYIDFGPHPGMDRLPREAALAGCLVVTNREGAANNPIDVPLPAKYKVLKFDPEEIHKLLKDLIQNVEERNKDLEEYRTWIRGQKEQMTTCVANLFEELVTKRIKSTI